MSIHTASPDVQSKIARFLTLPETKMLYCTCKKIQEGRSSATDLFDTDTLATKDHRNRTTLHIAVINGASIDEITKLIERNPQMLLQKDGLGCTPLHCALLCHPLKQLGNFISIFTNDIGCIGKNALVMKNNNNELPIHIVMSPLKNTGSVSIEVVKLLATQEVFQTCYSTPVDCEDLETCHSTPAECESFHYSNNFRMSTRPDIVDAFVGVFPKIVRMVDNEHKTPLCIAVQYKLGRNQERESLESIKRLIQAWPKALTIPDIFNKTPLIYAIDNDDVPAVLLLATQLSINVGFGDATDILAYCLDRMDASYIEWRILECIVKLTTAKRLLHRDTTGRTPLHHLVKMSVESDDANFITNNAAYIIGCFADCSPAALSQIDKAGQTPLHTAVKCSKYYRFMNIGEHPMTQIVQCLGTRMKYQDEHAFSIQNNQKQTALHIAVLDAACRRDGLRRCEPPADMPSAKDKYIYATILHLARVGPGALELQDMNRKTPLALAQDLELREVVDILQCFCVV